MQNEENQEQNQTLCKVCQSLKIKKVKGKYPGGKSTRFVDENDKEWNGKTCPGCNKDRVKKTMQTKRLVPPDSNNETT